jgi:hypothetical protein
MWETAVDIAQIGSTVIAATVAAFAYRQMKQTDKHLSLTQQGMESSLRPWMGAAAEGLKVDDSGVFIFNYHNYGQLTAQNVTVEIALSDVKVERQELLEKPFSAPDKQTILLPNESKYRKATFDFDKRKPVGSSIFVGVMIKYEYGSGRKALYGNRT